MCAQKKIDTAQIKETNIAQSMHVLMYSQYDSLIGSIQSDDKSREAIETCSQSVIKSQEELSNAISQLDSYINDLADAFDNMDKDLAKQLDITNLTMERSTPNERNRPSMYRGAI